MRVSVPKLIVGRVTRAVACRAKRHPLKAREHGATVAGDLNLRTLRLRGGAEKPIANGGSKPTRVLIRTAEDQAWLCAWRALNTKPKSIAGDRGIAEPPEAGALRTA